MDALPHFLLDALNDSITSGTFVDTKLYAFSRREASGRVGSSRAIYGNSRVLKTVPYFSSLLSDKYSEGQAKDINEGFPSDVDPHTEYYGDLSDSDLEVESCCSERDEKPYEDDDISEPEKGDEPRPPRVPQDPDSRIPPSTSSGNSPQPPQVATEVQDNHRSHSGSVGMGKVAIVHDTAAVTLEAMVYYLYTGKIIFAPFKSDPRYEVPAESKTGDWNIAKIPSPSAKSIYRLADMCDIPALKAQAKAYIYENLVHCDIVNEVFSGFSFSFPEILSVQVSQLVNKIKEESREGSGSITRRQLQEKTADLSQPQFARATCALAMIWNELVGPLNLPTSGPTSTSSGKCAQFSELERLILPLPSNEQRIKLALLKSISTGTFIDVQFHAYNAILHSLPSELKPLFTSSIIIEDWAPAITTETVGIHSDAVRLVDGLTDDYETWDEPPEAFDKDKSALKYRSEAASIKGREVMVLMSGTWKTWRSLFSYAYTNEMTFAPLPPPTCNDNTVENAKVQGQQSCSPRSMYSLATILGIERIQADSLKNIQSKLTASNIAQELFTLFAANHDTVADIEIDFLLAHFTERDPKFLIEHMQRMASGKAQLFPMVLSFLYDKLVGRALTHPVAPGSSAGKSTDNKPAHQKRKKKKATESGSQAIPGPTPAAQPSNSISSNPLPSQTPEPVSEPTPAAQPSNSISSNSLPSQQVPQPVSEPTPAARPSRSISNNSLPSQQVPQPVPEINPLGTFLRCSQCYHPAKLQGLHDGIRCPRCPSRGYMKCPYCSHVRTTPELYCAGRGCQVRFL